VVNTSGKLGGYAFGQSLKAQKLSQLGLKIENQKINNFLKRRWQPKFTNYFLAIPLAKTEQSKLKKLQSKIQTELKDTSFLNWQNPQTAHLTLQFFGNLNLADFAKIVAQLRQLETKPFARKLDLSREIQFQNLNYFRSSKKGGIGYLECQKNCIEAQKLKLAFDFLNSNCSKKYLPHLTLFRIKNPAQFKANQKIIEKIVKDYRLELKPNHLRISAAVDGKHQTPLIDFSLQ
jgi:2'-5' RNA ligase